MCRVRDGYSRTRVGKHCAEMLSKKLDGKFKRTAFI